MFDGLFGWLRRSVHAAVIGGVQDAVTDLTTAKIADAPEEVVLRLSFRPAEQTEAAPTKKRRAE